jgi:hypothetical protein
MYTLAILAGIGCCLALYLSRRCSLDERAFACFIGSFIGAILSILVGGIIAVNTPTRDVVLGPATLVSMRTSDGVTGAFIFGSGSIESSSKYNFMMKMDDGSLAPGWVFSDSTVRIIEDKSLEGVGYWRTTVREVDTESALYNWGLLHRSRVTIRQEFRVPVGTVVQGFKVQ